MNIKGFNNVRIVVKTFSCAELKEKIQQATQAKSRPSIASRSGTSKEAMNIALLTASRRAVIHVEKHDFKHRQREIRLWDDCEITQNRITQNKHEGVDFCIFRRRARVPCDGSAGVLSLFCLG